MKRDHLIPVLLVVASLVLSGYVAYTNNDKAITGRVIAVETQQKNDGSRLERIEAKLDRLLEAIHVH